MVALNLCVREILLYCSISIQNRVRPCKPDENLTKNVAYLTCSFNRNVEEKFNKTTMRETCSPRSKYHYTKMKFPIKNLFCMTKSTGNCGFGFIY